MHHCQQKIISTLAFKTQASFAELNVDQLTTDWFSFHLRQVVKNNLVQKLPNGQYTLTDEGKKQSLQLDFAADQSEKSPRLSVLLVVKNQEKYVVQQRKRQPFQGFWEFPTKKIGFGQSPLAVVQNVLASELGLEGAAEFVGVLHKLERHQEHELFDDKYYLVFLVENAHGSLQTSCAEADSFWLTRAEFDAKELSHFDQTATFELLNPSSNQLKEVVGEVEMY